jgi:hypothetical protein
MSGYLGVPPKNLANPFIASWCEVGTIVGICGFLTPLVAGWDVAITPEMLASARSMQKRPHITGFLFASLA